MSPVEFFKKKINKIKNRFDVKRVPNILQKELESLAYLKKI
tara:strand:+ start:970 stop:1092 length:123 start_codon:yes stop_codon:yes gene_type:complete